VGESETVLLDLTAGRYYTVNGTGVDTTSGCGL
jgi:hypothetical protein